MFELPGSEGMVRGLFFADFHGKEEIVDALHAKAEKIVKAVDVVFVEFFEQGVDLTDKDEKAIKKSLTTYLLREPKKASKQELEEHEKTSAKHAKAIMAIAAAAKSAGKQVLGIETKDAHKVDVFQRMLKKFNNVWLDHIMKTCSGPPPLSFALFAGQAHGKAIMTLSYPEKAKGYSCPLQMSGYYVDSTKKWKSFDITKALPYS